MRDVFPLLAISLPVLLRFTGILAAAGPLAFSDPAHTPPPPAHAIGFPERDATFDVLPGFQNPPPGYGEVAFYWWLGDPLTRERLSWQLEQLDRAKGVMGLQINYAHSDRGGQSYGLTYPSEPPLFSKPWWDLAGWFMQEAKQRGMAVSLSDYTLGFGQGWCVDEILQTHPELAGMVLRMGSDGKVTPESVPMSLNPMHPMSGKLYAEKFFGQFEQHFPGEGGKGLNFFFSDELGFGVSGNLWSADFAEEFKKRKGYDLVPELPALFRDTGPRTPKVRLDYRDVMVALTEEGFFKPVFDWHQQRGMIYGCDHGGRGRNVVEFGDYFRTQRWNQGPGCDQPGLGRDLIKNKVASSIAHLYLRPRVWLEGFYGSGWGTNTARLTDATFANFAQGQNLLTLHGLYYSTHGGYWEWAPPCNHFRMPYWAHMDRYLAMVQRLSYLLSQGHHRCDVAVLYPVAPMEAGLGGKESVDAAFETGRQLYAHGLDFDFMDFESLARAHVEQKELCVSGERYRVLVLPEMRAVRWSTIQKAVDFQQAGGHVILLGALPEASDRAGREDAELQALVARLTTRVRTPGEVAAWVEQAFPPDFAMLAPETAAPNFLHRRIGPRDVYLVHNAPQDAECWFRATGKAELWDPWTGETRPLPVLAQTAEGTRLRLPLTMPEAQLIVFSPGEAELAPSLAIRHPHTQISLDGEWEFALQPVLDNRFGDFHWPPSPELLGAEVRQFRYADEASPDPGWQGAGFDDSKWALATHSFGPKFWKLGPLPPGVDLDSQLAALQAVDPAVPVESGGRRYRWQPYDFSWRWGIEGNPGHQGYHGLKENVTDNFIGLGRPASAKNETIFGPEPGGTRYYLWSSVASEVECQAQALAGPIKPSAAWLNHQRLAPNGAASLRAGSNPLLLRYDQPGRTYFVFSTAKPSTAPGDVMEESPLSAADAGAPFSSAAMWIWLEPAAGERCFRKSFTLDQAPAKARLRVTGDDGYRAWLNGTETGSGSRWQRVQEFDVTAQLRTGANALAITAHNRGGPGGVLAELILSDANGATRRIATDASWRAWVGNSIQTDEAVSKPAQQISAYAGSLWATHPDGPPQLDTAPRPSAAASPSVAEENHGRLAMRWHNDPAILPYDTRPQVAQPAGWYRFRAAPGLRELQVPAAGGARAWINGEPVRGTRTAAGWRFELAGPVQTAAVVALRIEPPRGCYGGAAIPEPIRQVCGAGRMEPGDWSKIDGLTCYSGGACYRRRVTLAAEQISGPVVLDLGNAVSSAEVRVNGELAGIRVAPPWRVDISKQVRPGENRIEVLVYNTLANHYLTIPTRYRGELTSGLLGPVKLEIAKAP